MAIFVDTSFIIALIHEGDAHHMKANAAIEGIAEGERLVTTDLVIAELFNFFAEKSMALRQRAAAMFHVRIRPNPAWKLVRLKPEAFDAAAEAYGTARTSRKSAPGLVDLHSMGVMRGEGVKVVWTFDPAFRAAGFDTPLLPRLKS